MTNYSQVFADTLALYESNYVPGDQGDAGKGQVTVRAGYTIHTTLDANVGYIAKTPGQTQFYGVAVDALQDKGDGFGADYLTDELQPDGRRLIKLAYTAYPTPSVPPTAGWVQPTLGMLDHPGPLTLKADTPDPGPEPLPPPADDVVLAALDDIAATQAVHTELMEQLKLAQSADTAAVLTAVDGVLGRLNDIVEDVEESLRKIGIFVFIRRARPEDVQP